MKSTRKERAEAILGGAVVTGLLVILAGIAVIYWPLALIVGGGLVTWIAADAYRDLNKPKE